MREDHVAHTGERDLGGNRYLEDAHEFAALDSQHGATEYLARRGVDDGLLEPPRFVQFDGPGDGAPRYLEHPDVPALLAAL